MRININKHQTETQQINDLREELVRTIVNQNLE